MHKYYRPVLFLLAFVLAFSLVGCGTASNSAQNGSEKKTEKTVKVAKQEKKDDSKKEADQTGSASAGTDSNNQQNAVSSDGATNSPSTQTTNKAVSSTQPAANSTQPTQPKTTTTTAAANTTAPAVTTPAPSPKVTISIIGPKDHSSILGATKVDFRDGDTVMDVLLKAAGKKVDYSGSGSTAYVEGIDNVYEFDYGPQSGWTYKLNGTMIQQSAGAVKVKDGDQIVWTYKEG